MKGFVEPKGLAWGVYLRLNAGWILLAQFARYSVYLSLEIHAIRTSPHAAGIAARQKHIRPVEAVARCLQVTIEAGINQLPQFLGIVSNDSTHAQFRLQIVSVGAGIGIIRGR